MKDDQEFMMFNGKMIFRHTAFSTTLDYFLKLQNRTRLFAGFSLRAEWSQFIINGIDTSDCF